MKRPGILLPWLLLLLAVADWAGLKAGWLGHAPWILAATAGAGMLAFIARLVVLTATVVRHGTRRGTAAGEGLLILGVMIALGAGLANWLLSLQGYAILLERETVPLSGGTHLQEFDAGPLASIDSMQLLLSLRKLELVAAGPGHYYPESRLTIQPRDGAQADLAVAPGKVGAFGDLRFYQGAFGFAPRIVLLREERQVFDEVVPFTTERPGPTGPSFRGLFTIARERLEIEGTVDLASLDEGMRGHATLQLEVRREGEVLGSGGLRPGHFAEIGEEFRVGFAGLERWSEIDISRRNYGGAVKLGAALIVIGALVLVLASRGRR